jgi:hypothetical protein
MDDNTEEKYILTILFIKQTKKNCTIGPPVDPVTSFSSRPLE